jgi:lysophospholipase L1-like esterase
MTRETGAKLFSLFLALIIICGAELALRLWPPAILRDRADGHLQSIISILRRDNELFWTQRGNLHQSFFGAPLATDEFGLRNPAHYITQSGPDREFRILILGASPSFGWGVADEQTYPRLLEKQLSARWPCPIRVINASVIGYSSWQGLALLEKYADIFRPNQIIASYMINDVSRERFFYSGAAPDKELRVRCAGFFNFLDNLALAKFAAGLASRCRAERFPGHDFPARVSLQDFEDNHREFIRIARQRHAGIDFLFIPFRFPPTGRDDYRAQELLAVMRREMAYLDRLKRISQNYHIGLVDMAAPFHARYSDYYLVERGDHIHPNPRGQRLIADELTRVMLARLRDGIAGNNK